MEVADVRRRLLGALAKARHDAAERRARNDAAARDYEEFLARAAVPIFHQLRAALTAEGHLFNVFTPAGSVRLASERSPAEAYIELSLDDTSDPPQVIGRTTRGRGRRVVSSERPVREQTAIASLGDEDVLSFLLEEIVLLLER
jgi:hypothetical protein